MLDDAQTLTPTMVQHPIWCQGQGETPWFRSQETCEQEQEHIGRTYTLDCEGIDWSVELRPQQMFEDFEGVRLPHRSVVRLTTIEHAMVQEPSHAYLSSDDCRRLIRMLETALRDIESDEQ